MFSMDIPTSVLTGCEAIRRHAPKDNPLRLNLEDWVARGGRTFAEREQTMAIVAAVLFATACANAYWTELK